MLAGVVAEGLRAWFQIASPSVEVLHYALFASLFAWVVAGCYRLFAAELRYRLQPWVLPCFVLWLAALAGFAFLRLSPLYHVHLLRLGDTLGWAAYALMVIFSVALAVTYIAVMVERKTSPELRRFLLAARRRSLVEAASRSPLWLAPGLIAAVVTVPLAPLLQYLVTLDPPGVDRPIVAAFPIVFLLFALRDVMLVYLATLDRSFRRSGIATLVYVVLLHGVGLAVREIDGMAPVAAALSPWAVDWHDGWSQVSAGCGALGAIVILGFLLLRRWRAITARVAAAG